ncbi:PREDICTED: probable tyrosyl-DNA phosphodiesterase [Cyphomyrmex costatus]|uniref:probable tyrosyl-DNA phosphodiesterase n=1 Tax=Cyphomyrmex costatus TaxID=456900 RepID=UPI0008522485|nr:PREDICTED: probable tyrosyl-DNA phosphodiesterase [Cyphomyrmex costatus]
MRQKMNIKNDTRKNNQQNISNHRSSCRIKSSGTSINMSSIMNIFQACKTQKLRKKISKKAIKMMRQLGHTIVQPGEFAIKYAYSAPYYLFLTRIENSKETYKQDFSITFPEILDCSLGEIVNSLHLNFTVDIEWLCWQYLLAGQRTDMTILYSDRIYYQKKLINNITVVKVNIETEFSCHHTKMMILQYKDDGIRVIVSTANLRSIDWENMTQGLWISPHLPRLLESANPSDGESLTGFKKDLVRYLNKYGVNEQPVLMEWISVVQKADFSEVNVFFIASVPGIYKKNEANFWGHKKLAHVLSCHVTLPSDVFPWPIVAQSSCIGKLGSNFESWLLKDIISCMSRETINNTKGDLEFKFIYPSIQNYKQSFSYQNLSWCSPYSQEKHSKQQWLDLYLHQWKAERTERDRAMPHIKSYTRISSDLKSIPWFVLTSANLSKAAWGKIQSSGYYIGNYEAGVVFVPKFITGTTTFPIENKDSVVPVFPIPYDLPLSQYESNDGPFVVEFCNSLRWTRWMRSTEKVIF